jgi:hypothetical protein
MRRRLVAAPTFPSELQEVRARLDAYDAHVSRVRWAHDDRARYAWRPRTKRPRALDHYMRLHNELTDRSLQSLAIHCTSNGVAREKSAPCSLADMATCGVPNACAVLIERAQKQNL